MYEKMVVGSGWPKQAVRGFICGRLSQDEMT